MNMRKSKIGIILSFLLIFSASIFAQDEISIPYDCGFEDSVEISKWNLNVGREANQCLDKWMIGNLDYSGGYNSLYISCDTGQTTSFGAKQNVVIAYRKIKFPSYLDSINKKGVSIDIAFDWKCMGEKDNIMLNFYFKSADPNRFNINNIGSTLNKGIIPRTWALGNADATLYSSRKWQTWTSPNESKYKIKGGDEFYVIFVWQNRNQNVDREEPMAICLDNLQITLRNTPRPTGLTASSHDTTIVVEWGGNALSYDVQYRLSGKKWVSMPNLSADAKQQNRVELTDLEEGLYDIRVRGRNSDKQEDVSAWVMTSAICYIPDNHCIDFIHLDTPTVTCLVNDASFNELVPTKIGRYGAGALSNGETSIGSRHQVIWTQGAVDPRTDNQLKLIPDENFVSVRLGNWAEGGESEAIVFEYMVDTMDAKIILMKYAVVLEAPGHGPDEDPYFGLQILDENGDLLNPSCGKFDFTPEDDDINWNKTGPYVWKDWTSIGMNIEQYHGQLIKIRLETRDCKRQGHAGYAYFTLDCVDATIKTTSCGESVNMEMIAPDGFDYKWTNRKNPDVVVSRERILSVPANDTATYDCRVEYRDKEGCGFDLSTSVYPRFPFANFEWKWVPSNCENKILLVNKGLVRTKIKGEYVDLSEKIEYSYWSIDEENWYSSKMDSVVFVADSNGDTLSVNLEVGLSSVCTHDTTINIIVEPIHGHLDTLYEKYCAGDFRIFNNEYLAQSGVYTEILKNQYGCDSITVLDLVFLPKIEDTYIDTTICSLDSLTLWGSVYKDSGTYEKMLKTKRGCDSVVILNLTKIDPLGVYIPIREQEVCADQEVLNFEFDFIDTLRHPASCSVIFDSLALACGFVNKSDIAIDEVNKFLSVVLPDSCRPNRYTAKFIFSDTTSICGDIEIPIEFDVYYSSSILQPKFNNLIALLDKETNGGYEFITYQWYKNGELMEGEIDPYLYLPEGETFADGDCYHLLLKRKDDGVVLKTCEVCPATTPIDDVEASDIAISATLLNKGQSILIQNFDKGLVNIYSFTGQLIDSYKITSEMTEIFAPNQQGFYLLELITTDDNSVYKIYVKDN